MREQARDDQAEPDAAQAEHRVLLVHPAHRLQQQPRRAAASSPLASATATLTDSSVRSGRNSCSGGSISRTVTGRPSIAAKIPTKSSRCSGSSASSAACRSSVVVGQDQPLDELRGGRRGTCARCGTARCPAAPNRRARAASSGVSALARTPSRRASSAWPIRPVDGRDQRGRASAVERRPRSTARPARLRPAPRRGRPRRWCRRSR